MRLCVVSGTFHPEPGGPPTYLYHLLPALQARGHSLSVITYGEAEQHHPDWYPYPVTRISRHQPIPARLLAMTCEVLRQGRHADLLFVSDYGLPAALANLWLRKPMVQKVVADFAWEFTVRHGWSKLLSVDEFQRARHPLRVRMVRAVQRLYTNQARAIIAPSAYIAEMVRGWGIPGEKIRVIYNAIPGKLPAPPTRIAARQGLDWLEEATIFVTVTRLAPHKRVDFIVQALARLPMGELYVVGDGPSRSALAALVEGLGMTGRVHLMGILPHEDTLRVVRAADIFVLSSHTEGLSHVLLEAMQLGTPCIANAVGGNLEVICDSETGILVPDGDVEALTEAMQALASDSALRDRLARAASADVVRFSWERLVEQTEALLREVAGE
jgi:glycosyltransferase involved in cell wall biosynthesis